MTPKELHDELKRLETAAGGTEVYDDSHLRYALRNNLPTILRALSALSGLESVKGALKAADQFIENGVELGYIRLPTVPSDPALKTPGLIKSALSQLEAAG